MSCRTGLLRLGDPTGKDERDWTRAMRRGPSSITTYADGSRLLQWHSGTYIRQHVAVLFNPVHRFVRITHRYQC